jgi:membrane associated rhomboid family serine protease
VLVALAARSHGAPHKQVVQRSPFFFGMHSALLLLLTAAATAGANRLAGLELRRADRRDSSSLLAARSSAVARPYRRQRDTPVTQFLLYANVGAYLVLARRQPLFRLLAKDDAVIRRGAVHSYRLLTSCFLHANLPHLLINANSLRSLGASVEPWFGSTPTAVVYLASGLAGNLLSLQTRTAPLSVGASGCIFGLLGAYATFLHANADFFATRGMDVGASLRSLWQSCALSAAIGLACAATRAPHAQHPHAARLPRPHVRASAEQPRAHPRASRELLARTRGARLSRRPGSMIDNAGHLGGLVGGAAAAHLIGPRLRTSWSGAVVNEPRLRLPSVRADDGAGRLRGRPRGRPAAQRPQQRRFAAGSVSR